MQKVGWIALLCFASAGSVWAQNAEQVFRDSVTHRELVLRDFSADSDMHLQWTNSTLRMKPPHWHMLGALTVSSVHLKSDQLHISAIRQMLVRDKKDILGPKGDAEPVEIYVDLNGADPAVVLPQIEEKLFFPAVNDAVAAIPKDLRDKVPGSLRKADKTPRLPPCDCAARDTDACVNRDATTGWKHPQVLHVVDPHYTEEARKKRLNGTVTLSITLDASGRIIDLWVTTPLGSGLEAAAVRAVGQYTFAPATCHAMPVQTSIYADVRFEIF